MGDDLFLSPEITMHEEAGEVIIPGHPTGHQFQEEYEAENAPSMPFANGGIPPEISITKVTGTNRATLSNKPMLKVRSDLGANGGVPASLNGPPPRPMQNRPPPLVRGGLPPMPRLRMGGPRHPNQPSNPLMGMMNMMGQNPLPRLPRHPLRGTGPRGIMGGNMRPPHMNRGGNMPRGPMPLNPNSLLAHRPRPPPPGAAGAQFLNNSSVQMTRVPASSPSSSAGGPPPMMRVGSGGMRTPNQLPNRPVQVSRTVFVPPPMPHGQQLSQQQQFQQYQQQQQQLQKQQQPAVTYPRNAQAGLMGVRRNLDHFSNGKNNASILQNQLARAQIQQQQQLFQQHEEEEDDDGMIDEEELDDVEPDVDPDTNEVDDVEPEDEQEEEDEDEEEDDEEEENETIRSLKNSFSHEVSVSITSIKKKSTQPPASPAASDNGIVLPGMPVTAPAPSPSHDSVEVHVTQPGGGGGENGGFAAKAGHASGGLVSRFKKKKKKKAFRGGNYRFDGKSVKKRGGGRRVGGLTRSENGDSFSNVENMEDLEDLEGEELEEGEVRSPSVLSYLGIHRKESSDLGDSPESLNGVQKAKKSFAKASVISRNSSMDSMESANSLKRRLSLSEVLNNQKRVRSDQQQKVMRSSFGGQATPNAGQSLLKANNGSAIPNLGLPNGITLTPQLGNDVDSVAKGELVAEPEEVLPLVCACAKDAEELTELAPSKQGVANTCQAVESIGPNKVGCKNKAKDLKYRRAAERVGKMILCQVHIDRLANHHSCGFCGEFCCHGIFFMCRPNKRSPPHFFHKHCYLKQEASVRKCPHCEVMDEPLTVQLKLSMADVPVNLLQVVSKMGFPTLPKTAKGKKANEVKVSASKDTDFISYKLANGKVISSEGLPEGIESEALEKILTTLEDKANLHKTTRNMYPPVKSGDNVKLVQMLSLGYSPNQRFTEAEGGMPLHVAAAEGHVLTAHILVQAGAEIDTLDEEQNSALMIACINGSHEVVKYLLQAGADPSLKGDDDMTSLHLATQSGHLECAHALLNRPNLPKNYLNLQDGGGWTPLVWACENKHESVIKYLLRRGSDPLITDFEGNIALHWASLAGVRSTCELLLNAGCDVNATNNNGETPMHIAIRQDHLECVVLFLMRKARLDIRNENGQLPVDCMAEDEPKCKTIMKLSTTLHQMMAEAKPLPGQFNAQILERIVTQDLSRGKETIGIQCVNGMDDVGEPSGYVYVPKNCVTDAVPVERNISKLQHCNCADNCGSEDKCHCSDLSVKSWYDEDGRLKEGFDYKEPPMIFECNDMCGCSVNKCHNRVLQHGISARMQVFRTYGMGWGVKAMAEIPKGSFVCEYVGELISDSEADTREDSYLFDLDNRDGDTFCIDANRFGNIARFVNHSCSPNLVPVKVFSDHQDLRFPHIAFFASRDIKKGEELGFDYGEKFWVIKHKYFTCHCSSDKCRYNKSNIQSFLKEYYNRIGEPMPAPETPKPEPKVEDKAETKLEGASEVDSEAAAGTATPTSEKEAKVEKAASEAGSIGSEDSTSASSSSGKKRGRKKKSQS